VADNFEANAGSGGSIFAADDISSVFYPRVKPSWGADGSAVDASVAAPLPVQASIESSQMTVGGTVTAPLFAVISASTDNGNNTLVAADATKKIRVLSYVYVCDAAVSVRFEGGADGTALTGVMPWVANTGTSSGYNPHGHFETATNTLLNMELTGTGNVFGHLTYVLV
jgi:hypothetical protein